MPDNPGGMAAMERELGRARHEAVLADNRAKEWRRDAELLQGDLDNVEEALRRALRRYPGAILGSKPDDTVIELFREEIAALGVEATGDQTKPDRAESLDQNESPGGSP